MSPRLVLGFKSFALAIAFLTLAAAVAVSVAPQRAGDGADHARTLQGGFYPAVINVTVTNEIGRLMPAATVKVSGNSSNIQTNPAGYVLVNVLAEESGTDFILWANKTGYENSTASQITVHANTTVQVNLEVRGGTILGTVVSSSTPPTPLIDATVTISSLGYVVTVTNPDGSYIIEGIPGGTYSVTANATGYTPKSQDVTVPVGGISQSNFVLTSKTGSISGYTLHKTLGTPLNGTDISVRVLTITVTVTSGPDGSYNLTDLPPGTYSLTATKPGYYDNITTNVQVVSGEWTRNVNFTLEERPTLLHGVVRSGNLLLVGVNISIVGTGFYNLSVADGTFQIRNVTAGTYTVNATKEGYLPFSQAVVIPPGGEAELLINLTGIPGAILRGVVVSSDENHLPLTYVLVTIIGSSQWQMSVLSNIKGEFEFTGLTAGNYTIELERDGFRPISIGHVVVESNKTTEMTFQMMPIRHGFSGFIFGFDMAHSMMILALFLTIVILATAVYLRIRTFQAPESAPAVYDEAEEEEKAAEGEPSPDASSAKEDDSAANGERKDGA